MASKQETRNEAVAMEEMIAVAKSSLGVEAKTQTQPSVVGEFMNNRRQTLRLCASHSWTGHFNQKPAEIVSAGAGGTYSHIGSAGAFIYGQAQGGSNPAGYLLAWSSVSGGPLRVYVNCGPVSEIYHKGWESAALASLNSSGDKSSAKDDRTSSSAQAQISDDSGTTPTSVVLAIFT